MGAGMELVLGKHAGQSQVVGRMSGDAGAFPECVGNTLITPDRTTNQVRSSGKARAGICRSSCKGLTRDATRRLRFVVHAVCWLHSMVLHGRMSICYVLEREIHYLHCFGLLSGLMRSRLEHYRVECLFRATRSPEKIARKNKRIFYPQLITYQDLK